MDGSYQVIQSLFPREEPPLPTLSDEYGLDNQGAAFNS